MGGAMGVFGALLALVAAALLPTVSQAASAASCGVTSKCTNFPFSKTPFGVSNVRYSSTTGQLCYSLSTSRSCSSCNYACRRTLGVQTLYHMVTDIGIKPKLVAKPSGGTARVSGPSCISKLGAAAAVTALPVGGNAATSRAVVSKTGAATSTVCLRYPVDTPFRRIGTLTNANLKLPNPQVCCPTTAAYKTQSARIMVWARGAGDRKGSGSGCQGCITTTVSLNSGSVQGTVYQDSNQDNTLTNGVDAPMEGIAVNLWRVAGAARTFAGCTSTNSAGIYQFARLVGDRYTVQFVRQDAGVGSAMRFAARNKASTAARSSQVYGSGQSASFTITNRVLTINALIQIVSASSA
mmetsp:Transcript_13199/g.39956  ORF Transcript_13199/g.39956 Transcript_13199/m.39956 type:complete len:352 (-) Transcript_13199:421-1476(-)